MASVPPPAPSGSLLIGRVLGVEIRVHFSWLIVFALVTWTLATGYFPAYHPDLPAASYWAKALVALTMILFIVTIVYHMWLGMQVVIEDYVHDLLLRPIAAMSNTFFCVVVGLASTYAILKLSFSV